MAADPTVFTLDDPTFPPTTATPYFNLGDFQWFGFLVPLPTDRESRMYAVVGSDDALRGVEGSDDAVRRLVGKDTAVRRLVGEKGP